jgi:hypothetical protein
MSLQLSVKWETMTMNKRRTTILIVVGITILGATVAWATTDPNTPEENTEIERLKGRITDLENRISAIEKGSALRVLPDWPFRRTPTNPPTDSEIKRMDKRITDLERRIKGLEQRLPSRNLPSIPWRFDSPVPKDWQPWEFNGRTYYWIPLGLGSEPMDRVGKP